MVFKTAEFEKKRFRYNCFLIFFQTPNKEIFVL